MSDPFTCPKCGADTLHHSDDGFYSDCWECKGVAEEINDKAAKYQYLNSQTRAAADERVKREQKENQE